MAIHPAAAAHGRDAQVPPARDSLVVVGDVLVLHAQADLVVLLALCRNVLRPLPARKVCFRIDTINAGVAQRSEARLNAVLHACGCQAANVAGSMGLLGYGLGLFVARGAPAHWTWIHLWAGLGLCLAASVLGRGLHHLRTRRKLVRELRLLIAQTCSG